MCRCGCARTRYPRPRDSGNGDETGSHVKEFENVEELGWPETFFEGVSLIPTANEELIPRMHCRGNQTLRIKTWFELESSPELNYEIELRVGRTDEDNYQFGRLLFEAANDTVLEVDTVVDMTLRLGYVHNGTETIVRTIEGQFGETRDMAFLALFCLSSTDSQLVFHIIGEARDTQGGGSANHFGFNSPAVTFFATVPDKATNPDIYGEQVSWIALQDSSAHRLSAFLWTGQDDREDCTFCRQGAMDCERVSNSPKTIQVNVNGIANDLSTGNAVHTLWPDSLFTTPLAGYPAGLLTGTPPEGKEVDGGWVSRDDMFLEEIGATYANYNSNPTSDARTEIVFSYAGTWDDHPNKFIVIITIWAYGGVWKATFTADPPATDCQVTTSLTWSLDSGHGELRAATAPPPGFAAPDFTNAFIATQEQPFSIS